MVWPWARSDRHIGQERLSELLDGRLEPAATARVQAHLAACRDCRSEIEELRSTVALLHGMAPVRAPRSFRLRPEQFPSRAAPPFVDLFGALRLAAAGAAALLLVVVAAEVILPQSRSAAPVLAPSSAFRAAQDAAPAVPGATPRAGEPEDRAPRDAFQAPAAAPSSAGTPAAPGGQAADAPPVQKSEADRDPPAQPPPSRSPGDAGGAEPPSPSAPSAAGLSPIRIVEGVLLALALGLGGAAVIAGRRRSR